MISPNIGQGYEFTIFKKHARGFFSDNELKVEKVCPHSINTIVAYYCTKP